jgi:hypothetical protein
MFRRRWVVMTVLTGAGVALVLALTQGHASTGRVTAPSSEASTGASGQPVAAPGAGERTGESGRTASGSG